MTTPSEKNSKKEIKTLPATPLTTPRSIQPRYHPGLRDAILQHDGALRGNSFENSWEICRKDDATPKKRCMIRLIWMLIFPSLHLIEVGEHGFDG